MKYQLTKQLLKNYYSTLYKQLKTGNDRISPQHFNEIKEYEFNIILKKIDNRSYRFTSFKEITLTSDRKVFIPTIRDRLVLEYLKDRIKQKYRITFPNRDNIIKSIQLKLDSNMNFYIIRLDIKQFFNSIPQNILLSRIKEKSLLSSHEYYILKELFKKFKHGLPQGISISNVLSEIYMESFDQELKKIHNRINYYCRYVDDILLIFNGNLSNNEINDIKEKITSIFKQHQLRINEDKMKFTIFPLAKTRDTDSQSFEYLGYKFFILNKKIYYTISDNKIDRYIEKLKRCFQDFIINRNIELLINRLDFLTKRNAIIKKEQFITRTKKIGYNKKRIYFGFMENYNLISKEEQTKIANKIDRIILSEINNVKNILNSNLYNISSKDKRRLYSISLTRNMDIYNAFYHYKKIDYIRKLTAINPNFTENDLIIINYNELSKMYFNFLKSDIMI